MLPDEDLALPLCLKMRGPYTNLRPGGGPGGFTVRPTGFTLTPFGESTEWMTGATAMRAGVMLTPSGLRKYQTQISLLIGNITGSPETSPASSQAGRGSESRYRVF